MPAGLTPIEEPEPSEYNEGWRLWIVVGSAAVLLATLATALAGVVGAAT